MGIKILKTSSYLPGAPVDNSYFESYLDTSNEWIHQRTGIKTRHFSKDEGTDTMAIKAAKKLNLTSDEIKKISLVLVATSTASSTYPTNACLLQQALGLREDIFAADINMACTGFVAALRLGESMLKKGELALIAGSEVLSQILDKNDRTTVILFGDAAGCALLEKSDNKTIFDGGTRCSHALDGAMLPITGQKRYLKMDGKEVFRFAVQVMNQTIAKLLQESKNQSDDIDWYILHQANKRIIDGIAKKLNVSDDKFPKNMFKYGNTSSASIPLLMDEMNSQGLIKQGQKVIIAGFGAGLTWQSAYLTW